MQHGTFDIDDVRREMRNLIEPIQIQLNDQGSSILSLNNTVSTAQPSYAEIVNLLDNSHPEWSKAAYTTLGVTPATAGDTNHEAYNWFRQISSAVTLAQSAANAVKAAAHSLFAANEGVNLDIPRWDRASGQIELGGETELWDLNYKLPTNLVFPGMTFYVQFEAMLRTADALPGDLQFFAAFYDNSAGQEKIIEGGDFTITGEIFGIKGATTVSYQVKAFTDSGEEAISNILVFTDANTVFSQNNHPRINLRGAPGFTKFEVYRLKNSVYSLQHTVINSIDSQFFDTENAPRNVVAGFPSLTATPPRAYAKTRTFSPGASFVRHGLTILVPTTYDRTVTAVDSQWLKLGLTDFTDVEGQIVIRRIGLSSGDGQWSRSANDSREGVHSSPTSTPTSSGSGGSGGGVYPPDSPGSGSCALLGALINIFENSKNYSKISLSEFKNRVDSGQEVYADSCGVIHGKAKGFKTGVVSRIFRVKTANGCEEGFTWDHPLITNAEDIFGTQVETLKKRLDAGRRVTTLTKIDMEEESEIVSIIEEFGQFEVGIPILKGSHICVISGFVSHNKPPFSDIV